MKVLNPLFAFTDYIITVYVCVLVCLSKFLFVGASVHLVVVVVSSSSVTGLPRRHTQPSIKTNSKDIELHKTKT